MAAENMEPNKASLIERLDHDLRAAPLFGRPIQLS
jgi:hypothetical protein